MALQLTKKELAGAMVTRVSRRTYVGGVSAPESRVLQEMIEEINQKSGLSICLVQNGGRLFNGFLKSYGMFSGVQSFFALVGLVDDANVYEKAGYYGEQLVLQATQMCLGTCWVGGTFDRKALAKTLLPDEILVAVITVGRVEEALGTKDRFIRKLTHRKSKPVESFYTADAPPPEWFLRGAQALPQAPSAVNRQLVHVTHQEGKTSISVPEETSMLLIDLGIAKLHFSLAAVGEFGLGNGAIFTKAE